MANTFNDLTIRLNNEGILKTIPTLLLLDIPTETELKKSNMNVPDENSIYVFCTTLIANAELDIKTGTTFDSLIALKDQEHALQCDAVLKYVSVNRSYEIDYLPGGQTGICLLEFPNGKPAILNKLSYYGQKKDPSLHDKLVLTQKSLLDMLIK